MWCDSKLSGLTSFDYTATQWVKKRVKNQQGRLWVHETPVREKKISSHITYEKKSLYRHMRKKALHWQKKAVYKAFDAHGTVVSQNNYDVLRLMIVSAANWLKKTAC